ncbi:MAG TPA: TetR/AcrR family transcriptional regulator [Nocardioidaceae bacterium]|nr:TetR/AcrR family transcriptional regulator [Nocardioidaceae bacterium]
MTNVAGEPETQPLRRGRGRPRDPQTDESIIQAAADLLRERGFERMTVDDVAATAGVGKATVYRRWPSKDDLAVAAMERLYSVEMPQPDTGSIRADLAESYRAALTFVGSPQGAAYLKMSIAESVRDDRIAALYRTATERTEQQARQMFLRAIERGEIRDDADLDCCVQWLGGVIAVRAITNRPLPTVEDVPRLVELTLRGVLIEGGRQNDGRPS